MIPFKLKSLKAFTVLLGLICLSQLYVFYNSSYSGKNRAIKFFDRSTASTTFQSLLQYGESQQFHKLPLEKRCTSYFDQLYKIDENWNIGQLKDLSYSFDVSDDETYYAKTFEKVEQDYKNQNKPIDQEAAMKVFDDVKKKLETNEQVEQRLKNSVGHLRVYGTCYVKDEESAKHSRCRDIEARLFPWMTMDSPVFERWDGTILNEFPDISKYYQYKGMGKKKKAGSSKNDCFLYNFKDQFNGKGIVLSIGDQLVEEAINLIKVLRYYRNELPIQFVHKGDLSHESKQKLKEACRYNLYLKNSIVIDFAPQEAWFVDANRCFHQEYYHNFNHFANKWIAVVFNSFEDMILMDTDALPFIEPEKFFEIGNYKQKGAYFFKDRTSLQPIPDRFKELYFKLFPTFAETSLFGVPQVGEVTLNNRLFANKLRHSMESGIVVMNKRKKLLGILVAVHIQFWGPLTEHIHGEKEIFWLSQSIAGDEAYEFNPNSAGAVGELQEATDKYPEHVIGIQPAHVAGDDKTLLWMNSGVKHCKHTSWDHDFDNSPALKGKFESKEALKAYYNAPIDIKSVVIPPESFKEWPNKAGAPVKGWEIRQDWGCEGYHWAAYSKVGGPQTLEPETNGKIVNFGPEMSAFYNKIAKIWITPLEKPQ